MSLVGKHESPILEPEPLLSEDVVIPILDSIISRGSESGLKHSEFPKKWRDEQSTQMDQFIQRYNDYLTNQRYCCSKCNRLCVVPAHFEPGHITQATVSVDQSKHIILMLKSCRLVCDRNFFKLLKP